MLPETTKAYSDDLRERAIKIYKSGVSKKEIFDIFVTGMDTLNRLVRKYKEAGSAEPCNRTKYREKISDEYLREHVLKNTSAAPEERALFFSVKHQSVYARMKALGITPKKRPFFMKKETRKKDVNSAG